MIDRDFARMCELRGVGMFELLEQLASKEMAQYLDEDGCFSPRAALWNRSAGPKSCWVLGDAIMAGRRYKKALCDGELYKIPEELIKILD